MASTEPPEFKKLVELIRKVEKILGRKEKFKTIRVRKFFFSKKINCCFQKYKKRRVVIIIHLTTKRPVKVYHQCFGMK